jgi:hypothetical protein
MARKPRIKYKGAFYHVITREGRMWSNYLLTIAIDEPRKAACALM